MSATPAGGLVGGNHLYGARSVSCSNALREVHALQCVNSARAHAKVGGPSFWIVLNNIAAAVGLVDMTI